MNLRLDQRSVRVRLTASEAERLLSLGAISESWAIAGLGLRVEVVLRGEGPELEVCFDQVHDRTESPTHCRVSVGRTALARELARVPARDAGLTCTQTDQLKLSLEIDAFSVKDARREGRTEGTT